jgi:predicted CXXCH cytochrome family protein
MQEGRLIRKKLLLTVPLALFFSVLYLGRSTGKLVDHASCKNCHEKTYTEAMWLPFRHPPIDEKCGACHVIEKARAVPFSVSSGYAVDVLVLLHMATGRRNYEIILTDVTGRKSRPRALTVDAEKIGGIIKKEPIAIGPVTIEEIKPGAFFSVTLSWTTSVFARSGVEYAESAAYDNIAAGADFSRTHRVTLTGLKKNAVHRYRIFARDVFGGMAYSDALEFDTKKTIPAKTEKRTFPRVEETGVLKTPSGDIYMLVTANKPSIVRVREIEREESPPAHGGGFKRPIEVEINSCVECHPQGISHPVGVSAKTERTSVPEDLPTLPGGIITCNTCHKPHGGEREYYARMDFERDICTRCHTDPAFI